MKMTIDPELLKEIEKTVEKKVLKSLETIQLAQLRKEFLTRQDFMDAMDRMDKRFDEMLKNSDIRFDEMQKKSDKRFDEMQKKSDKRFDATQREMNQRFEAMQKQIDKRFDKVYERLDSIDLGYGYVVEGMAYSIIKREFKQRELDLDLKIRQHFTDENYTVHPDTQDVEVDIFHLKDNFKRFLFCFKIDDRIKGELINLLQKYNIELIIPKIDS
jgi:exonuclease VII large subunit